MRVASTRLAQAGGVRRYSGQGMRTPHHPLPPSVASTSPCMAVHLLQENLHVNPGLLVGGQANPVFSFHEDIMVLQSGVFNKKGIN